MLAALSVRDVVLIERLDLSFESGLCVLTGETGAGKSILLDALGLALGARGDASLVRHGADQASVTAEFHLPLDHPALDLLREQELDAEPDLILRRTVSRDGRSRAFVNDQAVGVTLLRRLGEMLVEVHGQFDTHGLLDPQTHRDVLDAFGEMTEDARRVASLWQAWRAAVRARDDADEAMRRARAEEDYLRHAVAELDELAPRPGEEEELAERRTFLMNREKVLGAMNAAYAELSGERGAERAVSAAQRHLARIADQAGGRLEAVLTALDGAAVQIAEAVAELEAQSTDVEADPQALEKLEERLFTLRAVARKHAVEVTALPDLRAELAGRLALIEDQGDVLSRLTKDVAAARAAYVEAAEALSAKRQAAAAQLDTAMAAELPPLKLERARFHTSVERLPEEGWNEGGVDRVAFLVATNPGAPPGAIGKIASGGELSRFMLALKVVLTKTTSAGTLVFDEVDAGIGGATAAAVGERLGRLGESVQVLVVTHSPQVAARGTTHLQVRKLARGGGVATDVARLSPEERREEIARMLSGAKVTDEARAAAEALIGAHGGDALPNLK